MRFLFFAFFVLPVFSAAQDTVSLLFSGDIMGHQAQIQAARVGRNRYDYRSCFQYMKPVLESVDLAVGNLETTLPGRPPFTGHIFAPIFRSPDALAEALREAGFDAMMTANNHSNDGRRRGLRGTIRTLRQLGFRQTGTFLNAADRAKNCPLIVEKKGFRIAFLNATHVGTNFQPTPRPFKVNRFDTLQIRRDLEKCRALGADFVFFVAHWGPEHILEESKKQRLEAEFLIQNGVDCIVGMHPHVAQPIRKMTVFDEKTGHSRSSLVAFSLGNFVSNHRLPNTDGGLMLRVEIARDSSGKAAISRHGFLPVWRLIEKKMDGKEAFFVLPALEIEQKRIVCLGLEAENQRKMLQYAEGVRARLGRSLEWREPVLVNKIPQKFEFERPKMGSPFSISVWADDSTGLAAAIEKAFAEADSTNAIFSDYDPKSELSRLCRAAKKGVWQAVSPRFFELLRTSIEAARASRGAFDPTVGPVVGLWREARKTRKMPPENARRAVLERVGWRKIELDETSQKMRFLADSMRLDFGGIAKGEAAQRAVNSLKKAGFSNILVNSGGDLALGDAPPDRLGWSIAVELPAEKGYFSSSENELFERFFMLKNVGIATSGDAFQNVEIGGRRFSHIVDPRTGLGLEHRRSVTVIARDGATADWLATALSVSKIRKARRLARRLEADFLILENGKNGLRSWRSKSLEQHF